MCTLLTARAANSRTDVSPVALARLAGPLALVAGSLFTGTQLVMLARIAQVDQADMQYREILFADPVYLMSGVVYFVAYCLIMLALVAIYGRYDNQAGGLWATGVCAAVVGTLASAGNAGWADVFAMPWIAEVAPEVLQVRPTSGMYVMGAFASYVLFTLGWVLFGLTSFHARIFPVAVCLAFVVGGVLAFNASPPFGIPLGLALAWLGVWMLRTQHTTRTIGEPATSFT